MKKKTCAERKSTASLLDSQLYNMYLLLLSYVQMYYFFLFLINHMLHHECDE